MNYKNKKIVLKSLGHFHPNNLIENSFFNELNIDADELWIEERVGIKSRYSVLTKNHIYDLRYNKTTVDKLRKDAQILSIAQMAKEAFSLAKYRYPQVDQNVDMLICGTSIPDFDIPANACIIAEGLGIQCPSFDINSACSSFIVNLHFARSLLLNGTCKKILISNPERYTLRLNYQDRSSCVLFGDASTIAVLEAVNDDELGNEGFELIDTMVNGDPFKYKLVVIPDGGMFSQEGTAVQKFAITKTIESTESILYQNNYTIENLDYFIGHQANYRMLTVVISKLSLDTHKHLYNIDRCANQGGAGAPSVLSENWDKFKPNELLVISVVGSGLSWGSALLRKL